MSYDDQIASARRVVDAALRHLRHLLLLAALERDGPTCYYCGVLTEEKTRPDRWFLQRTVDHIRPLARGGDDVVENVRVACMSCNTRKGVKDVRAFSQR